MAVGLFVLVSLAVPLLVTDLCPFSKAPMFADSPKLYCDYQVFSPQGEKLEPIDFGLQRNYWGNPPGVGVGYSPPESVDVFGQVASREAVEEMVSRRLTARPDLPFVEVIQILVFPLPEGRLGTREENRWRVQNPHSPAHTGGRP
jgi:hypothetical protein